MTTVGSRIERFKEQVAEEWRDPRVTESYRKWNRDESEWGRSASELIIARAGITAGANVLDIGSAHGEPGLSIAAAVGPRGQVTLTDLAPGLLEIASERARAAGLTNVQIQAVDAHALPFPDSTFDFVTSRWAAMYFADVSASLGEARRVLKPGGRATYLVWGGFDQPIFRDVVGTLFQYVAPPEDEPGAPSPFRFAEPGTLTQALRDAGFVDVDETAATIPTTFAGEPERWWEWFVDMAVPLQSLIASLSPGDRDKALAQIRAVLRTFHRGGVITMPVDVIVGVGTKAG